MFLLSHSSNSLNIFQKSFHLNSSEPVNSALDRRNTNVAAIQNEGIDLQMQGKPGQLEGFRLLAHLIIYSSLNYFIHQAIF